MGSELNGEIATLGSGDISLEGTSGAANVPAVDFVSPTTEVTAGGNLSLTSNVGPINTPGGITAQTQFSVATTTINGRLAPGQSPGQLRMNSDFEMGTGDILDMEVDDFTTAGIDYDQIVVSGSVDVSGATFSLSDTSGVLSEDPETLILISNDGADPVVGTFNGLPNGSAVPGNGKTWYLYYNGGDGNDVVLSSDRTEIGIAPRVYLQGASLNPNPGEESLMRDDLRTNSLVPLTSPYGDGSVADAAVLAVAGADAIVDWVWVELRDKDDNGIVVGSRSALLQRDGDVVGPDGASSVLFDQPTDSYHVAVNHRNHIGIISATAQALVGGSTTLVDLTSTPTAVEGGTNSVVLLSNGRFGMYTGDYDANGQIQNTDANDVVQLIGGSGYDAADMDTNTQIQNTDVNSLINPNIGRGQQFRDGAGGPPGITLSFANAVVTNDGLDDYYEADIMISGTEDFYVGSGQLYLDYNTEAFGDNVSANGAMEYGQPDGSILGHSFGMFSPAYKDFVQNDNTDSRVSLSFQQNIALIGLETAPVIQVTDTPKLLLHIKIRYMDPGKDADICFHSDGVFQDQFFTACGGAGIADCTTAPGMQILDDTYDCSAAGVDTLGVAELTEGAIVLYPNPTHDSFYIKGITEPYAVNIYDVGGKLVMELGDVMDRPIDMGRFEDGMYLVEIMTANGPLVKRLIKAEQR